jgi:hypothetical protein
MLFALLAGLLLLRLDTAASDRPLTDDEVRALLASPTPVPCKLAGPKMGELLERGASGKPGMVACTPAGRIWAKKTKFTWSLTPEDILAGEREGFTVDAYPPNAVDGDVTQVTDVAIEGSVGQATLQPSHVGESLRTIRVSGRTVTLTGVIGVFSLAAVERLVAADPKAEFVVRITTNKKKAHRYRVKGSEVGLPERPRH